jgi:hypothetical protein
MTARKWSRSPDSIETCQWVAASFSVMHVFWLVVLVASPRGGAGAMVAFTRRHHDERFLFASAGVVILLAADRVFQRAAPRRAVEALADQIPTVVGVSFGVLFQIGMLLWPLVIVAVARR